MDIYQAYSILRDRMQLWGISLLTVYDDQSVTKIQICKQFSLSDQLFYFFYLHKASCSML